MLWSRFVRIIDNLLITAKYFTFIIDMIVMVIIAPRTIIVSPVLYAGWLYLDNISCTCMSLSLLSIVYTGI